MTTKHTVQDWMRTGTTVYALNVEGTNRFSAQVQGGWATDGRLRTDAEELEANARLIAASPRMYSYVESRADAGDEEAKKIIAEVSGA